MLGAMNPDLDPAALAQAAAEQQQQAAVPPDGGASVGDVVAGAVDVVSEVGVEAVAEGASSLVEGLFSLFD